MKKLVVFMGGQKMTILPKAGHQLFRRERYSDPNQIAYVNLSSIVCTTKQKGSRVLTIVPPKNTEFRFTHVSDYAAEQAWYNSKMGLDLTAPKGAVVEKKEEGLLEPLKKATAKPVEVIEEAPTVEAKPKPAKPSTEDRVQYIKDALEAGDKVKDILTALDISRATYYKLKAQIEDA